MIYEKTKIKFLNSYLNLNIANKKFKAIEYILNDFHKFSKTLTTLVAWIMGDGSFSREFKMILHGQKEDLLKVAEEVRTQFDLEPVIKKRQYKNSHYLYFRSRNILAFNRLIHSLGAPIGEKVKQPFLVPDWIMNGNKEVKRRFLQTLFSNELDSPRIIKNRNGFSLHQLRLRMFKMEILQDSFTIFFNQIKSLCSGFKIETSRILIFNSKMDKEGRICSGFFIRSNYENMLRYFKEISYPYSTFKQDRLNKFIPTIIQNLKKDLEQNRMYDLVKKLHCKYKSQIKIIKKTGVPLSTFSGWLYENKKPKRYENKGLSRILAACENILKDT